MKPSDLTLWAHFCQDSVSTAIQESNDLLKFYNEASADPDFVVCTNAIASFFRGFGPRHLADKVANELYLLWQEQGSAIYEQPQAMATSVMSRFATGAEVEQNIITAQPRAITAAASSATTEVVSFEASINYLVYAFLSIIYENSDKKFGKDTSLSYAFPMQLKFLPEMEMETFNVLLAKAIMRVFYEHFDQEQYGKLKYNLAADNYFWCAKCTVGNSVVPGVLFTIPQVADFFATIPWQVQASLPGIMLLLGLVINYSLCEAKACCGMNALPKYSATHPPTREFLTIRRRQWVMLATTIFGLAAETLGPILRAQVLPSIVSTSTATAVTSLPASLGVIGLSGFVAYKLASECQRRGLCQDAPMTSILTQLKEFACWSAHGCCLPSLCGTCAGYTVLE